jgi:regulator of replication initiation timing
MKKRKAGTTSTVTIPLAKYEQMQNKIKDLTIALEKVNEAVENALEENGRLREINAEIKDKYFALWAQMKN